jgi:hypothetical protein
MLPRPTRRVFIGAAALAPALGLAAWRPVREGNRKKIKRYSIRHKRKETRDKETICTNKT